MLALLVGCSGRGMSPGEQSPATPTSQAPTDGADGTFPPSPMAPPSNDVTASPPNAMTTGSGAGTTPPGCEDVTPEPIAQGELDPRFLVVDNNNVYWTARPPTGGSDSAEVRRWS